MTGGAASGQRDDYGDNMFGTTRIATDQTLPAARQRWVGFLVAVFPQIVYHDA